MSGSSGKRRQLAEANEGPATKKTRGASAAVVKMEDAKVVLPPKGATVEELGFDPFAPHPGMSKEQRKVARMIRNRTAAQVSRDRKKEHVSELEDRVRELESQLLAFQRSGAPSMSSSTSSASPIPPPSIDLPALSRPIRTPSPSPSSFSSASTISPLQAASLSQARIAVLEEENEGLKKRLEEGEREKAELKGRLEGVEKRFEWMERVLNGVVNLTSGPAAPTSTPAPAPAVASTDAVDWTHLLSTFNNQPQQPSAYSTAADRGGLVAGSGSNGINERLVAREESLQRTLTMLLRLPSALPSPSPSRPRSQREKKSAVRARSTSRVSTLTLGSLACPPRLLPRRRAWTGRGHQGCGKIRLVVRRQTRS